MAKFGKYKPSGEEPQQAFVDEPLAEAEETLANPEDSYTSLPSIPVTVSDIPEVTGVDIEFVYNYYVEDERTNDSGNMGQIDLSDPSQVSRAELLADRMPRYASIFLL